MGIWSGMKNRRKSTFLAARGSDSPARKGLSLAGVRGADRGWKVRGVSVVKASPRREDKTRAFSLSLNAAAVRSKRNQSTANGEEEATTLLTFRAHFFCGATFTAHYSFTTSSSTQLRV